MVRTDDGGGEVISGDNVASAAPERLRIAAMDDPQRVAAVLANDPAGLASCYDTYADRLFAFCESMLRDRQAAEDAVHDTFVVLALRVAQLRDPSRLRPWLYAIARSECLRQLRDRKRAVPRDDLPELQDDTVIPGADIEQAELRALVWQAADGLNAGERAALELSLRHGLAGEDLAAALGVPRGTLNKLLQRGREQLERGLAVLVVSRPGASECPELAELTADWDRKLTVLMRKRISRHIDGCATCEESRRRRVNAAFLLQGEPLQMAPVSLRERLLAEPPTRTSRPDRVAAAKAGGFDRQGFPASVERRRRRVGFYISAIAGCLLVLSAVSVHVVRSSASSHAAASPPVPTSKLLSSSHVAPSSSPPATVPTSPTPGGGSAPGPSFAARPSSVVPLPTTSRPVTASGTTSPVQPPPSPPLLPTADSSPPPPAGALAIDASKVGIFAPATSATLVLTATGGPVTWSGSASDAGLTMSPAAGTIADGQSQTVTVALNSSATASGNGRLTFSNGAVSTPVTVEWSR